MKSIQQILREKFPPEKIAEIIATLPPESQERLKAYTAERPVRRIYRVTFNKKKRR